MIYSVRHTTVYEYSEPVTMHHNIVHLTPRDGTRQTCGHSELRIDPAPSGSSRFTDHFGNTTDYFSVQGPHRRLSVSVESEVHVPEFHPPPPESTPEWEAVRDQAARGRTAETLEAFSFTFESMYVRPLAEALEYAADSFWPGRPILSAVLDLTARIKADFKYDPRSTTISTPVEDVFRSRRGVCQDFAHLQLCCLRCLGLPARYVSGYLRTLPPPGRPRLVGADASHAWVSAWVPGSGWIDVDPTNNQLVSDQHITLAVGRDFDDVSPIKGVLIGGGKHTPHVSVDVIPLGE